MSLILVNVGCGKTFHPAWRNFDVRPTAPGVERLDVRRGLPFAQSTCDAVYHSHVLEHLDRVTAVKFISEAVRVLKPQGVMRVVVPDLEEIARLYLASLDRALAGKDATDHEWMTLEIVDQLTRGAPGGEMAEFLHRFEPSPGSFVFSRLGGETRALYDARHNLSSPGHSTLYNLWARRLVQVGAWCLLGPRGRTSVREGFFRAQGEVHRWMYDRFSLSRLLCSCGLTDVRRCLASESRIPDFGTYGLDQVAGGTRKPDSLFIEGRKS